VARLAFGKLARPHPGPASMSAIGKRQAVAMDSNRRMAVDEGKEK